MQSPACPAESWKGFAMTFEFRPELLGLVPAFLPVSFMIWVLWNLHKQIKR
jgi:hypothetical protein